jgi:hypothetical protein
MNMETIITREDDSSRIVEMARQCNFGEIQSYGPVSVIPVLSEGKASGPEYVSLSEALEDGMIEVTEVSEGGSVPYLNVKNLSARKVLLLDGEELMGAKQNRVLNTTVLVSEEEELTIPVSCTERGRWRYKGKTFEDSNLIMAKKTQYLKSSSVSHSLCVNESYDSDQGSVWESIDAMHAKYASGSHTAAMKHVYDQQGELLSAYVEKFPCVEKQRGVVVFVDGELAGCEMLSRNQPYLRCHEKIIKSFCIDLLHRSIEKDEKIGSQDKAMDWLSSIERWKSERFKSLGIGDDLRLKNGVSHGNALLADETVVHFVGFGPQVLEN